MSLLRQSLQQEARAGRIALDNHHQLGKSQSEILGLLTYSIVKPFFQGASN